MLLKFKEIFRYFTFSDERNFLSLFHKHLDFILKDILEVKLAILGRRRQLNADVLTLEVELFILVFELCLEFHDVF